MKIIILKLELQEIYLIVCDMWKKKIVNFILRNLFGDIIEFLVKEIEEMI